MSLLGIRHVAGNSGGSVRGRRPASLLIRRAAVGCIGLISVVDMLMQSTIKATQSLHFVGLSEVETAANNY